MIWQSQIHHFIISIMVLSVESFIAIAEIEIKDLFEDGYTDEIDFIEETIIEELSRRLATPKDRVKKDIKALRDKTLYFWVVNNKIIRVANDTYEEFF